MSGESQRRARPMAGGSLFCNEWQSPVLMYGGRSKLTHLTPTAPTFSLKAAMPPAVGVDLSLGQMQRHRRGGCLMPSRAIERCHRWTLNRFTSLAKPPSRAEAALRCLQFASDLNSKEMYVPSYYFEKTMTNIENCGI
jgi:hypothetical protein